MLAISRIYQESFMSPLQLGLFRKVGARHAVPVRKLGSFRIIGVPRGVRLGLFRIFGSWIGWPWGRIGFVLHFLVFHRSAAAEIGFVLRI